TAEVRPVFPKILRLENAGRSDDAGNQFRGRDIEARVESVAGRVCDSDVFPFAGLIEAPGTEHLAFVPFFNWNIETAGQIPINGAQWNRDVKGNVVALR